jgi:hypothetical protein
MTAQPKHKILIIGDSYVRSHAARLSDNLGHSINNTGYVKLNSNLDNITNKVKSQSKNTTKKNVIIL